ncbi:hypothetical protein ABZX98_07370 [Streptomyces sp. NPDC002992]|uniref:hypothetical protein n=1 Tax=Streptomyces sp. NPDC002992 TaxID=3154273 RepID=UPI0033BE3FCD
MPAHHARKGSARRRQAETGESYTDAAKALRRERYNRPVFDPWVAPRCEADDPIPGHDAWLSGPCPEGCPTRERPDYRAYLETLPPKERLPRPVVPMEPYECPGPATCDDGDCACNQVYMALCPACDYVYDLEPDSANTYPNGCRPM